MAAPVTTLVNIPEDMGTGLPVVGMLITIHLNLPPGLNTAPIDTVTGNPLDTTDKTLRTTSSGWTQTVVDPQDISPPGCTYTITEGTRVTQTPSFAYSATPLVVSDWYPTTNLLGRILMYVEIEQVTGDPAAGAKVRITLNNTSLWTGGIGTGQLILGNTALPFQVSAGGILSVALNRNSDLTPSVGGCTLTTPQNYQIVFNVPDAYTGDAGVYSGATTYAANAVVTDPTSGAPYISLAGGNVGHALSDGAHWAVYPGESITANLTSVSPPTSLPITPAMLTYGHRTLTGAAVTITSADDFVVLDATSANQVTTLPDITTWPGKPLFITRLDSTANTETLTAAAGQTIAGASTYTGLTTGGMSVTICPFGTDWKVF